MNDRIEEIKARESKATPELWTTEDLTSEVMEGYRQFYFENCPHGCADDDCGGHYEQRAFAVNGIGHIPDGDSEYWYFTEADAEFIAHARTDIPYLLAQLAERDATIERLIMLGDALEKRVRGNEIR